MKKLACLFTSLILLIMTGCVSTKVSLQRFQFKESIIVRDGSGNLVTNSQTIKDSTYLGLFIDTKN